MAETIGLDKHWFHASPYPHYDIPKKRIVEIEAFCEIVSPKDIVRICKGIFNEPRNFDL